MGWRDWGARRNSETLKKPKKKAGFCGSLGLSRVQVHNMSKVCLLCNLSVPQVCQRKVGLAKGKSASVSTPFPRDWNRVYLCLQSGCLFYFLLLCHADLLWLLQSLLEHFIVSYAVFQNAHSVVQRLACCLKALSFDIFVLGDDFLSIKLLDDLDLGVCLLANIHSNRRGLLWLSQAANFFWWWGSCFARWWTIHFILF